MAGKLTKEQVKQLTHNIPKTRYSWTLETYYARRLRQLISNWKQIASDHINRMINPLVTGGSLMLADDDHADDVAAAIAIMLVAINGSESDIYLASLATSFVNSVNTFSYHNVQAQANHVGLKAIESNSTIDDYTKMKIKENVALIKSMKQGFVDRIEKTIYESINSGGGVGQIAKFLTKTTQMANNHAALIANDQTGSILGQLDTYRQQKAGAYGYIWQSMEDARVRPTHQALDQTFQKYNDPDGGDDGQMPGEPIRCRCVALPTFDM
ncbi:phage minor head protein [Lentilactobacillus diolivorans]|uniref:phage minor head protein n=1 Tax=Lentilactobacillus diolivorans TaxID=179838 RepID=UPI00246958B7|nr:phage minor head protein [Lentilactobacillus diolivorans]MDH5106303.1 phage minor head protein [Lentilactobacillus diolivorans]